MPNPITWISSVLSQPLTSVMQAANDIIGRFIADPTAKLQAQQELVRLEQDFRVKMLDADTELAKQQAAVIIAENDNGSWLAQNWRPILMLTFTTIIAWNYIVSPLCRVPSVPIPPDMWDLLKLGIGGYIAGRSVEKIAPSIADAIASKKDA